LKKLFRKNLRVLLLFQTIMILCISLGIMLLVTFVLLLRYLRLSRSQLKRIKDLEKDALRPEETGESSSIALSDFEIIRISAPKPVSDHFFNLDSEDVSETCHCCSWNTGISPPDKLQRLYVDHTSDVPDQSSSITSLVDICQSNGMSQPSLDNSDSVTEEVPSIERVHTVKTHSRSQTSDSVVESLWNIDLSSYPYRSVRESQSKLYGMNEEAEGTDKV